MRFKKPSNTLEGQSKSDKKPAEERAGEGDYYPCPGCKKNIAKSELRENLNV